MYAVLNNISLKIYTQKPHSLQSCVLCSLTVDPINFGDWMGDSWGGGKFSEIPKVS